MKVSLARELTFTVLLLSIYGLFACRFIDDFMLTGRFSSLLFVVFESVVMVAVVARNRPKLLSSHASDWMAASLGTFLPTFFSVSATDASPLWLLVQLSGILISLVGIFSLNLSFGIVPANRGIKTSGIYHFIRHPLYTGYMFSNLAVVAQNMTEMNMVLFAVQFAMQIIRIQKEEKLLSEDNDYREYAQQVHWRLVPHVW